MAKLLKERARSPIIEMGAVVSSRKFDGERFSYRIDIYQPHPGHQYSIELTRAEMLGVISSWLAADARDANESEKRGAHNR